MVNFSPFRFIWLNSVHVSPFSLFQFILVYFSPFWFTSVCLFYFSDALREEVYEKREVASLTIMSYFQRNVHMFLMKLHLSYIIKVLYFFLNISDEFCLGVLILVNTIY